MSDDRRSRTTRPLVIAGLVLAFAVFYVIYFAALVRLTKLVLGVV